MQPPFSWAVMPPQDRSDSFSLTSDHGCVPTHKYGHRLAGSPLGLTGETCWVTSEHANISTRAHQKIRSAVHDRTKCLARANEPPSRVDHSYVYASSVPLVPLLHPTSARWHVHEAVLLSIQLVDVCRGDKYGVLDN